MYKLKRLVAILMHLILYLAWFYT